MYNYTTLPATGLGTGAAVTGSTFMWALLGAFAIVMLGVSGVRALGTFRSGA